MGLAVLLAVGPTHIPLAQSSNEVWPEVELDWRLDPQNRLVLQGSTTRNQETRSHTEGQIGAALDHRFSDTFSVRAGYLEAFSLAGSGPYREQRIWIDQTARFVPWQSVTVALRSREELRRVNGDISARVRERLQVARTVEIRDYAFAPYGSLELYYDSRYSDINRVRYTLGASFPVHDHLHVDVYGVRQVDSQPSRRSLNALGITAVFSY